MRRGSRELIDLLSTEAEEAFEERKRKARILGEKAGTKLIFPTMLMLLVVIAVIMTPAFVSFLWSAAPQTDNILFVKNNLIESTDNLSIPFCIILPLEIHTFIEYHFYAPQDIVSFLGKGTQSGVKKIHRNHSNCKTIQTMWRAWIGQPEAMSGSMRRSGINYEDY